MKLKLSELKRIIKEEVENVTKESRMDEMPPGMEGMNRRGSQSEPTGWSAAVGGPETDRILDATIKAWGNSLKAQMPGEEPTGAQARLEAIWKKVKREHRGNEVKAFFDEIESQLNRK